MPEATEEEIYSYINGIKNSEGDLRVLNSTWAFINYLRRVKVGRDLLEEIVYGSEFMMDKHYYEQITGNSPETIIKNWIDDKNPNKPMSASDGYVEFVQSIADTYLSKISNVTNDADGDTLILSKVGVSKQTKNLTKYIYKPRGDYTKRVYVAMFEIGKNEPKTTKQVYVYLKEFSGSEYIEGSVVPKQIADAFSTINNIFIKKLGTKLFINEEDGNGYYYNPNLKISFK